MRWVLILGAALFFALTNFVMKVKATTVKPLQSSVMFFASMSIIFWIAAPCEAPAMPWPPPAAAPTYALVYLSVACSALAFPAFFYVLRHSSLMFASTLAFVHTSDCAAYRLRSRTRIHAYNERLFRHECRFGSA